jgi:tellurite resistance protein
MNLQLKHQTHSMPNTFGLVVFNVAVATTHGALSGSCKPKPLPRLITIACSSPSLQLGQTAKIQVIIKLTVML